MLPLISKRLSFELTRCDCPRRPDSDGNLYKTSLVDDFSEEFVGSVEVDASLHPLRSSGSFVHSQLVDSIVLYIDEVEEYFSKI